VGQTNPNIDIQIQQYLNTDRLKHLVQLKYLNLYSDVIQRHYVTAGDQVGVLLRYPTQAVSWDRSLYPDAEQVLLPTASDRAMATQLLTEVQNRFATNTPLVFKFCDTLTKSVFEEAYTLRYADAYLSYTADPEAVFLLPGQVVCSDQLTDDCAALYITNGYDRADIEHYFAQGAISFTIYKPIDDHQVPITTCMVYQNFDNIWEIGGVHTIPSARRRGFARQVVMAALHTLLQQRKIPRYMASAKNTASIQLATGLGMRLCLHFEHFLYLP
jgi:RimJ/RimL family protein N-acetyltransferase